MVKSFEVSRNSIKMAIDAVTAMAPTNLMVMGIKATIDKFLNDTPEQYFKITIEGFKK